MREVDEDLYRSDGLLRRSYALLRRGQRPRQSRWHRSRRRRRALLRSRRGGGIEGGGAEEEEDSGLERRIDAADGGAYTLAEFREFYGGDKEWQAAERVGEGGVWDEAAAKLQAIARGRAARLKRRVPAEDAALDDYVRDVIEQAAAELDLEAEQKQQKDAEVAIQDTFEKKGKFRTHVCMLQRECIRQTKLGALVGESNLVKSTKTRGRTQNAHKSVSLARSRRLARMHWRSSVPTSAAEAFEAGYGRQRVASVDEEVDDEDRKDRATDHKHEGAERDNICRPWSGLQRAAVQPLR